MLSIAVLKAPDISAIAATHKALSEAERNMLELPLPA